MAAPETLTWDVPAIDGGARRPSISDVGDATLEDDSDKPPPKDGKHLYKDMCNQWAKQVAAFGRVVPSVRLTVDFSGGAPFVDRVMAPGTLIDASTFTLTDNADGDTTIAWTAGDLPPIECDPKAWMGGTGSWLHPVVETVSATSIRVRTRNSAGTLTDGRVTIEF